MFDDLFLAVLYFLDGTPVLNIAVIALFVAIGIRSKNMPHILIFFVYAAIHHVYAVPSMLIEDRARLAHLHEISNIGVLISGIIFLVVWLLFVFRDTRDYISNYSPFVKVYFSFFFVLICILLFESIFFAAPDAQRLAIKDNVSLLSTLVFAYVFSLVISHISLPWNVFELRIVLIISCLVLGVATYEVLSESAWAGMMVSDVRLYRASSTMLNPNVLGLWGGLLIFVGGYLLEKGHQPARFSYGMLVLGAVAIFLAGSRTSFLFCGMIIFLASGLKLFIGNSFKRSFQYFVVFMLSFVLICIAGKYLSLIFTWLSPIQRLAERFLLLPQLLYNALLGNTIEPMNRIVIEGRLGITSAAGEVAVPIYDNAYLGLMTNSLVAFFVWVSMTLFFLVIGVKKFLQHKDEQGVYALSALVAFIIIGLFIRAYQIFPVWGLSALLLGVFLAWMTTDEKLNYEKAS